MVERALTSVATGRMMQDIAAGKSARKPASLRGTASKCAVTLTSVSSLTAFFHRSGMWSFEGVETRGD